MPLVAYGVLSRGLISQSTLSNNVVMGEVRARMPRFAPGNLLRNRALIEALSDIARERGISIPQLAFAWLRSRGADIVPLIGARRREQLGEALKGLDIVLSAEEIDAIEAAVPHDAVAGQRYNAQAMRHLDSEVHG
jgi:aryl-alcohol dehydrogenase-like predicted oxidoreductase